MKKIEADYGNGVTVCMCECVHRVAQNIESDSTSVQPLGELHAFGRLRKPGIGLAH